MRRMNMKNLLLITTLLSVTIAYTACKDKDPVNPDDNVIDTVYEPDFTWTGKQYIHQPLTFTGNQDNNTVTLTWYVGNFYEETVQSRVFKYTFKDAGTFNITMASPEGKHAAVTKNVVITNGVERLSGSNKWNNILYRSKTGYPGAIPVTTFSRTLELIIPDDYSIQFPDLPELPMRGPYVMKLVQITDSNMRFESDTEVAELAYNFKNNIAGFDIKQVRNDSTWRITGSASIYQ